MLTIEASSVQLEMLALRLNAIGLALHECDPSVFYSCVCSISSVEELSGSSPYLTSTYEYCTSVHDWCFMIGKEGKGRGWEWDVGLRSLPQPLSRVHSRSGQRIGRLGMHALDVHVHVRYKTVLDVSAARARAGLCTARHACSQAPEVLLASLSDEPSLPPPGPAADVWSLGALLYFAYTGKHPLDEEKLTMLATGGNEAPSCVSIV